MKCGMWATGCVLWLALVAAVLFALGSMGVQERGIRA